MNEDNSKNGGGDDIENVQFLVNQGLQKLITWFIAFLTVFTGFFQILPRLRSFHSENLNFYSVLKFLSLNPLWIVEYFLLLGILFSIHKIFSSYANQMEWESMLSQELTNQLWRRADSITDSIISHDISSNSYIKWRNVRILMIGIFIILNWVLAVHL